VVGIPEAQVLTLDQQVGLHPSMGRLRRLYDQGNVAIVHGVGYPNSPRSHFRSMDIWHTCEPEKVGTEAMVTTMPDRMSGRYFAITFALKKVSRKRSQVDIVSAAESGR
jgi:uncharacterized protein (DUF1501 family)